MRVPSDPARRRRRARTFGRKRRVVFAIVVGALVVSLVAARGLARFYTDALWFSALGRAGVFSTMVRVKVALAFVFSIVAAAALFATMTIADRLEPFDLRSGTDEHLVDRYRVVMARRGTIVRAVVAAGFGLLAGVPVASQWQRWLLFTHAQSFATTELQFHRDLGFYVFRLPFITFVIDWAFTVTVIVTVVTAVIHYLNGGIRIGPSARILSAPTKVHLSVLLALLALLKAVAYWFQRYTLVWSTRGTVDGATFTDVHAQLPATLLLMLISLLAAAVLIATIRHRDWHLPTIVVASWLVVSVIAGVIYPAAVQRLRVKSDERNKERPYIERNIAATRLALGLDKVQTVSYPVTPGAINGQNLVAYSSQLANARLLDPKISASSFNRLAGEAGNFKFNELDVDRYRIGDKVQQVVIGARELDSSGLSNNSWVNRHLGYTHGRGVAVAPASQIADTGRPAFLDTGDTAGALALAQPRIYVGENLDSYAVVNTNQDELDGNQVIAPKYNAANGGVTLSSRLRRAAFALRFGEWNLFAPGPINSRSMILYVRDVRQRVQTLAPFLAIDADPYPVVLGGRIKWVLDGYTTTDRYPNAQRADTAGLPRDSGLLRPFNYVRNSVKAVVDAYDGSVVLYIVDDTDPIVRAWRTIFPSLFRPRSELPAGLDAHFRYPEDLFRVQSKMWGNYRLSDPLAFNDRNGSWIVSRRPAREQERNAAGGVSTIPTTLPPRLAADPTRAKDDGRIDPYYTLLEPPGGGPAQFVLIRPFVPYSKQDDRIELAAFMTASSDPGSYGTLRVYEIPAATRPDGPITVATDVSRQFSEELTLKDSAGSKVVFGDLQLMPVKDAIVWVRPWYVQETGDRPLPELRTVTVNTNRRSARGASLEEALRGLFGADPGFTTVIAGASSSAPAVNGGTATTKPPPASAPSTTKPPSSVGSEIETLLAQANAARAAADTALRQGNLGEYQAKMKEAYDSAERAARLGLSSVGSAGAATSTTAATAASTQASPPSGSSSLSSSASSVTTSSTPTTINT